MAADEAGDERAAAALAWIGQLDAIERDLPPLLPPADAPLAQHQRQGREAQRRHHRQQQAQPVLDELQRWLDAQQPQALPKSAFGQAIGYALNPWQALRRSLEQGYLAIANHRSERTWWAIALGRNNWGVLGSETGGRTAAVLSTIVATCKRRGIDPWAYRRAALPGRFALGEKPTVEQRTPWLPDRGLLSRSRDAPAHQPRAG